ncbi:MAG: hypothetical protein IIC74_08300 [Bacteroidetes bacterium]|nr:hypothetical protein [Bacteroidota bacterium]
MQKFKQRWEIQQNWQLIFPVLGISVLVYSSYKLALVFIKDSNIYITIFSTIILSFLLLKFILFLFKKLEKNGGQLFTYFQQDKNAEIIMLYASELDGNEIKYRNEIVKIEEDYRQTANVKDFFERWNKLPKTNGIFDNWVSAYEFQSKALTKKDLKVLKQEEIFFIAKRTMSDQIREDLEKEETKEID